MPPHTDHARWFSEEVQPHEPALRAYLRGRFPSLHDVDDLVQESYARILRAREIGTAKLSRAYLFVTARNLALDAVRHANVVPMESLAEVDESSVVEVRPDAAEIASCDQELEILAEAIATLPKRCREIFVLRRFRELSHREIALRLGIAENTVNAQLVIAMLRCRDYLRQRGVTSSGKGASGP
jgi:RNA polymerase sigma factor (sigma-70 family)